MKELFRQYRRGIIAIILLLVIALPLTIFQLGKQQEKRSGAAGPTVNITLSPSAGSQAVGSTFTVTMSINSAGSAIRALDATVTFDAAFIQLTSFAPSSSFDQVLVNGPPNNSVGSVRFAIGNSSSTPPNSTNVLVGTFTFTAKAAGTAKVSFGNLQIVDPNSTLLTPSFTTPAGTYTITAGLPTIGQPCDPTKGCQNNTINGGTQTVLCKPDINNTYTCQPDTGPGACPGQHQCGGAGACYPLCAKCTGVGAADPLTCPTATPAQPTLTPIPPTAVPTTPPAPTATPRPTTTTTPVPTGPTPTGGQNGGAKSLSLKISLPGIGKGTNPNVNLNNAPKRPTRDINIKVINAQGTETAINGTIPYNTTTGKFEGTASLGSALADGPYTVKVRMDNSLWKAVPGIIQLANGAITLPEIILVTGDVSQDNQMNIDDYNALTGCFGKTSCTNFAKIDLNDDGTIDDLDLSIMIAAFLKRNGD